MSDLGYQAGDRVFIFNRRGGFRSATVEKITKLGQLKLTSNINELVRTELFSKRGRKAGEHGYHGEWLVHKSEQADRAELCRRENNRRNLITAYKGRMNEMTQLPLHDAADRQAASKALRELADQLDQGEIK